MSSLVKLDQVLSLKAPVSHATTLTELPLSLKYACFLDVESLRGHFMGKSYRLEKHRALTNRTDTFILQENKDYGDIVSLLHVADVYRNLPFKLLQSLVWYVCVLFMKIQGVLKKPRPSKIFI